MKEHVEVVYHSFTDFEGKVHHIVLAAVSYRMKEVKLEDYDSSWLIHYGEYSQMDDCQVVKGIKLGIAICNPEDEYNEAMGREKAIARAKAAKTWALLATKGGYINTQMVQAFLKQEAEYIAANPALYIKGYKEKEERYVKKLEKEAEYNELSTEHKEIVKKINEDRTYLDKVLNFLGWKK